MMKILHVCLSGPYNDYWTYQENYLPYYHKKSGYDVSVLTTSFVNDIHSDGYNFVSSGEYIDNNGIKIIRLPHRFRQKSKISIRFRLYKGLYKHLQNEKPDIIFIHGLQFWDIHYIAKYAKLNPSVNIYVDGHEDFANSARNWLSKNILHKIIWKKCAKTIEPYTKTFWGVLPIRVDFLIRMYNLPKEKVKLLVMGADDEKVVIARNPEVRNKIRKQYNFKDEDFVIVSGGKIDLNKNIHLLMEAVANINHRNIKLIVFGSFEKSLKNKFDDLLAHPNINFVGWKNPDDIYNILGASDLAVFPGTHSVLWEQAVGTGVPAVFKYWPGMQHVDVGGNTRFIYRDSINEIEEIIKQLYNNVDEYNEMLAISKSKGINNFSYQNIAKKAIE